MKIESVEHLEALPVNSVILDADGIVMQHHGVLIDHEGAQERAWMSPPGVLRAESEVRLPATLLVPAVVTDEMVERAAKSLDDHSWLTDPDEGSMCDCGEALTPSLEYAGDAFRSHLARTALEAALGGGS